MGAFQVALEQQASLAGEAVDRQDRRLGIDLLHPEGEDFTLGLTDDVALGDHHHVGGLEHGTDLARGLDAAEVVHHAHGQHAAHVGRAAVAQAGAFADQEVQTLPAPPLDAGVDIGDEEMIRAQGAGQSGFYRDAGLLVALFVLAGEAVELDHAEMVPGVAKSFGGPQDHRGFSGRGRSGNGSQSHACMVSLTMGKKTASMAALACSKSLARI
ncbi:hypothetical protein DESC_880130 [Desulfosarcina cetonica]|nr:hypothetical protein DESC_880130 [Desulfosarcina cetonica]